MKGKYLITTDNWFIAPDGKSYRAVWGEAHTMTAVEALGVEPNRNSANWMVKVGTEEHHIILAGCQIHYAVSCPDRPFTGATKQVFQEDKGDSWLRDGQIYIPESPAQKDVEMVDGKEVEMVDGKEVEWLTDRNKLRDILQANIDLLRSPYIDAKDIARRVNAGAFKKFRSYRKNYARNITIEIVWGDDKIILLGEN